MAYYILTDYILKRILPGFSTWIIISCLEPLHAPLLHGSTCAITCSRIQCMLPSPDSITSITCFRIHYMRPVFSAQAIHSCQIVQCQSIGSGPGHRQLRSDRCVAPLARLARAVNSPPSVAFNLQDNIPACSDRTCSIQMRWLPAVPQHEVLAQLNLLLKSSSADGRWDQRCSEYPGYHY